MIIMLVDILMNTQTYITLIPIVHSDIKSEIHQNNINLLDFSRNNKNLYYSLKQENSFDTTHNYYIYLRDKKRRVNRIFILTEYREEWEG